LAETKAAPLFSIADYDNSPAAVLSWFTVGHKQLRLNVPSLLRTCRSSRSEGHKYFFRSNTILLRRSVFATSPKALLALYDRYSYFLGDICSILLEWTDLSVQ